MVGLSFAVADLFRVLHLRLNFNSPHTIELSRNQWISFENIWLEFELAHQSKREREREKMWKIWLAIINNKKQQH